MIRLIRILLTVGTLLSACQGREEPIASPEEVILRAGNAATEQERYQLLDGLSRRSDLDSQLKSDLVQLLRAIDRFANGLERYWEPGDQDMAGEDGYLGGFFVLDVWPIDDGYPHRVDELSPLYPLRSFYRARMLVWNAVEMGILQESCFDEAESLFRIAREAYPDNPTIPIYLGEEVSWPSLYEEDERAPRWANLQREALGKINEIIEFWIRERQAPDGQFGGGWGDDIEMWRRWSPILIGFKDPRIEESHSKLTEGIYALPRLAGGYSTVETDVEHSAEDSSDSITSMLHLDPDDPIWIGRATLLGELMEGVWSAVNDRGFLQFKSTYFTSDAVNSQSRYGCDTPYHARALQPLFLHWQRSGDPAVGALLMRWMDTWVDAASLTGREKPLGVLPAALSYPSGLVAGSSGPWHAPGCHITNDLFVYPRGLSLLIRALGLTAVLSGESTYLEPIVQLADIRRRALADTLAPDAEEGSELWVGLKSASALRAVLGKLRIATGVRDFDDLLERDGELMDRYALNRDTTLLEDGLESSLDTLSSNRAMFMEEVRFTDRIFSFHRKYLNEHFETSYDAVDFDLLYNMVSGDSGDPLMFPVAGVRWLTPPKDWAVLVTENSTSSLAASVYNFGGDARSLPGRALRLQPGNYLGTLTCDGGFQDSRTFDIRASSAEFTFSIPSRDLCSLRVSLEPQ